MGSFQVPVRLSLVKFTVRMLLLGIFEMCFEMYATDRLEGWFAWFACLDCQRLLGLTGAVGACYGCYG